MRSRFAAKSAARWRRASRTWAIRGWTRASCPSAPCAYSTDRAYWEKWFPADLVLESFPGQFRNWFYSMLAMSAMIDGRAPFKALLGHALVRDARGEEMHKSKGNSIAFDEAAEALGAEVMRYIYAEQKTAQNLNFPDLHPTGNVGQTIDGEARRKLLTFWNCYSFFVRYADGRRLEARRPAVPVTNELDRWVLSRLQRLVDAAQQRLRQLRALPPDRSLSGIRRGVLQLVSAPLAPPLLGQRQRSLSDDLHRADHRDPSDGAGAAVPDRRDLSEPGVLGRSVGARVRSLDRVIRRSTPR